MDKLDANILSLCASYLATLEVFRCSRLDKLWYNTVSCMPASFSESINLLREVPDHDCVMLQPEIHTKRYQFATYPALRRRPFLLRTIWWNMVYQRSGTEFWKTLTPTINRVCVTLKALPHTMKPIPPMITTMLPYLHTLVLCVDHDTWCRDFLSVDILRRIPRVEVYFDVQVFPSTRNVLEFNNTNGTRYEYTERVYGDIHPNYAFWHASSHVMPWVSKLHVRVTCQQASDFALRLLAKAGSRLNDIHVVCLRDEMITHDRDAAALFLQAHNYNCC